jgi:uncharacterized protein YoxC
MEIILYITGGIALLALAWLFISLASTISAVKQILTDVRGDLATVVATVDDLKTEVMPILGNVNGITSNINSITNGLQTQMISVHETIDDTLDVVRGTIDDIERLKDQLVATVEGPVSLVKTTTDGAVGAVFKGVGLLRRLMGGGKSSKRYRNSSNPGRSDSNGHSGMNGSFGRDGSSYSDVARNMESE